MYTIGRKALTDIADAIREKNGESTTYTLEEMAEKIRELIVKIPADSDSDLNE